MDVEDLFEFFLHGLSWNKGVKGFKLDREVVFGRWGDMRGLDDTLIGGFGRVVVFDGF